MEPLNFLDGLSGYVRNSTGNSADRPIRMAKIDPDYDPFGDNYPDFLEPARVTFEGETTLSGKAYPIASGYVPQPEARVWMAPIGNSWLIVGAVTQYTVQGFYASPDGLSVGTDFGGGSFYDVDAGLVIDADGEFSGTLVADDRIVVNNKDTIAVQLPTGGATNATTSFANVPGSTSMSFKKLYSSSVTKLIVSLKMSMQFTGTAPNVAEAGVNISGGSGDWVTDHSVMQAASNHYPFFGVRSISGLPAATYTIQARFRNVNASRTLLVDNNDFLYMTVEEVPV